MNVIPYLLLILIPILIYQMSAGFPLISKMRERIRKKRLISLQKTIELNEQKILLIDKKLTGENDIRNYIDLNRHNLPNDENWRFFLPNMIKDLLEVGWTTDIPIYTKYKYGEYQFHFSSSDYEVTKAFYEIVHLYEEKVQDVN